MEKDTSHFLRPLAGLRNNGEALFPKFDLNDSGIVSCDIQTKEFVSEIDYDVRAGRNLEIKRKLPSVRPFTETLVLLNDKHARKVPTPRYGETEFKTKY